MKAAFRLLRKRCPRVYLCARSSQSTSALLPSFPRPTSSSYLAPLRPSFSTLSCRSRVLFLPLYTYLSFSLFPLALSLYLLLSHIQAANFSSVFLLLILPFSHPLSPLVPAPFLLARFISARCQFEFGTRATGQRVSTKNQFLNARLFRAEGPAWYLPLTTLSSLFASSLCATAASIFFDGTLTPRCIV